MTLRLAQYHALQGESGWVRPDTLRTGVVRLNEMMASITYAQVDTDPPLSHPDHLPWLNQLLPPWVRMVGPLNRQHSTHDFTLDIHSHRLHDAPIQLPAPLWRPGHQQQHLLAA